MDTMDTNEVKVGKLEVALSKMYDMALIGMPNYQSVEETADYYISKYKSKEEAIDAFINWQITKCTTTGFITNIGGLITLPLAIPIDLASSLYIQLRMIAVIAKIRGYDTNSDEVRTFVYLALCGNAVSSIIKEFGIKLGVKYFGRAIMKKVTRSVLNKINKAVGSRLVTKRGPKGLINISKIIPVIGGVIGGGFNWVETRIIAKVAKEIFVNN